MRIGAVDAGPGEINSVVQILVHNDIIINSDSIINTNGIAFKELPIIPGQLLPVPHKHIRSRHRHV